MRDNILHIGQSLDECCFFVFAANTDTIAMYYRGTSQIA